MEPNTIIAIVAVANLAFSICTAIYAYNVKRRQATQDQIAKVQRDLTEEHKLLLQRIERHADRIGRVETRIDGVPTNEAISGLALSVERANGDLRTVTARLDAWEHNFRRVENVLSRQEQFLLDLGRSK